MVFWKSFDLQLQGWNSPSICRGTTQARLSTGKTLQCLKCLECLESFNLVLSWYVYQLSHIS